MRDNFPKKSSFQSKEEFRSNSAQNYLILYLFFETFWNDGTWKMEKASIGNFSLEILFQHNCAIWAQYGPNYAILCLRQLYLIIYSLKIFKCTMMGDNR